MNSFDFYNPVRIHFGPGTLKDTGSHAKALGSRICLVSYEELGHLEPICTKITGLLEEEGLTVFPFYKATPNPDIAMVSAGADFCKENRIDLIIGVGGGSVMDAAKAIAAGVYYEGDLWNMVYSRHDHVETVPPEKALPTLMIPTLPATGSEMNQCSVVSNRSLKEKSYIWAMPFPQFSNY